MAESKGSLLAKSVQKHAGRAKEKILQNLGKVDRTADEIFDNHLQNFTKQQNAANRLQKEFDNYIRCIRQTQVASKSLLEAIGDTYETQWTGHDLLYVQVQSLDMLWQDFSHKLADQVLVPLNTYQSQFPEMRKKIDKRGRKLVDYDSQRHNFQALQTNMKKRDDVKVAKGRELLEEAKRTYEILNSELHDELPALHDSRVLFLVTNLQSYFNTEHVFHTEWAKVFGELENIVDKLATDSQRGSYSVKKSIGDSSLPRPTSIVKNSDSFPTQNNDFRQPSPTSPKDKTPLSSSPVGRASIGNRSPEPSKLSPNSTLADESKPKNGKMDEMYDIPVEATTENLPPGVLYRVKATYKYTREDVDELSFESGEVINVIEYDDPEEQEEGWLMGFKENGEKGMFPANFTKPL